MRQCRMCQTYKEESEFAYRGGARKGLQADCKACSRERARSYRQSVRDRVGKFKMEKGCVDCGFKAVHPCQLDLDHTDPETKEYKGSHKSYDSGWSWKRVEQELAKCEVRCKNCHSLRTHKEGHWRNEHTDISMRQSSTQD